MFTQVCFLSCGAGDWTQSFPLSKHPTNRTFSPALRYHSVSRSAFRYRGISCFILKHFTCRFLKPLSTHQCLRILVLRRVSTSKTVMVTGEVRGWPRLECNVVKTFRLFESSWKALTSVQVSRPVGDSLNAGSEEVKLGIWSCEELWFLSFF